ncbi:NAD(P)/FAD-dependent oxidoreductase [Aromatoleum toluclasticum]|uniref:NAD(P)/FAD-dependent oxidoreductase n=1 Tax=Aromatoleum toluclasticum TaxID=92003 RepID=UPI000382A6FC|nr:NAD(P)/FAD-dependent oxidoreductase [Aromatoleum toluclasticum]
MNAQQALSRFPNLLSPGRLASLTLKNKMILPAMGTNYANADGTVSRRFTDYYVARAKGGFGLIVVEVAAVDPLGKAVGNEAGIWHDGQIPSWKAFVDEIHAHGAKVFLQLHHAGRQTSEAVIGERPVAPSPVPCPMVQELPRELTAAETWALIDKYRDAAVRAKAAGFDGVELHGAHGYLIAQFMSPDANKRFDEFGGDFVGRMRFPTEIVRRIKEANGRDYPVTIKVSGDEHVHGGRCIQETRAVARQLEEAGIDGIVVSLGTYASLAYISGPGGAMPPAYNASAAEEVKKSVKIPVVAVGRIADPFIAEDVLQSGAADFVAIGRAAIADPDFPNKVARYALDEVSPCLGCNQGCMGQVLDPEIMEVGCLVNPFCGYEGDRRILETDEPKSVMVVGAGPGGLSAAWIAAKRGHHVSCYDKESVLGGQFRVAAIPPGKQDLLKALKYYVTMCRKHGVEFRLGVEVNADLIAREKPEVVIFATGSTPRASQVPGADTLKTIAAQDVLEGRAKPGPRVVVIGGGMIGAETADFLSEYGHQVTVLGRNPVLAKDLAYNNRHFLIERLKHKGVVTITGAAVTELAEDRITYMRDGTPGQLTGFDSIVTAWGLIPNDALVDAIRDLVPEVHVIGDAVKVRSAVQAIAEASKVATAI